MKKSGTNITNERKKIVYVIHGLTNGGAERYLMNLLRNTYDRYDSTVLYFGQENSWKKDFDSMGVRAISIPDGFGKTFRIRRQIKKNKADVVYGCTYYVIPYALLAAFLSGVKMRIAHSHGVGKATFMGRVKRFIVKIIIAVFATHRFACSEKDGKLLFFDNRFKVINNGINLSEYIFDNDTRRIIRDNLKINNQTTVIGTVGRLDVNKNQKFAIDIVKDIIVRGLDYKLIIIGGGEEDIVLHNIVSEYNLEEYVVFLGDIKDVNKYYNALDVLLLPSYREGLPFVLIEAQANGLDVVASAAVAREAKINSNVWIMNLEDGCKKWGEMVVKIPKSRVKPNKRIDDYSVEKMIEEISAVYDGVK